jgi:DMSO/TMAO reductase YedYZ molybdopterin-dependent catalytic subunit
VVNGAPVGRRVFLGMLAAGTAGILWGRKAQDGLERVFAGNPVSQLLPTGGRFRYYTVTGGFPEKAPAAWRLTVDGLVDAPFTIGFDELASMTPTSITRDFQCVTGWRVHDVMWRGVRLADLLDRAGVRSNGKAVLFGSFDGAYTESLTIEQARRRDVMVAYELEGEAISALHGGPVRLYVAPMYGYKSLKWLESIEITDRLVPGYWEVRGYDQDAWVGRSNGRDDVAT